MERFQRRGEPTRWHSVASSFTSCKSYDLPFMATFYFSDENLPVQQRTREPWLLVHLFAVHAASSFIRNGDLCIFAAMHIQAT
jgi:hypothetical protein